MRALKTIWIALALFGCAGQNQQGDALTSGTQRPKSDSAIRAQEQAAQAPALEARELVVVPGGSFGPYVGRSAQSSVLLWAAPDQAGEGHWYSLHVEDEGQHSPLALGKAPDDLSLVAVRRAGADASAGYIVVAAEPRQDSAVVHVLQLGEQGQLEGAPITLAETAGPLLWLDALPSAGGALVFWAVSVRGVAEIYSAKLGADPSSNKVASDALAWQLAPFDRGAALASVTQNGVKRDVVLRFLDEQGKAAKQPLVLRTRSQAQLDLDLANLDGQLVAAWSEQSHLEPVLFAAAVDKAGQISQAAKRLTAPMGEQALVRLVPSAPGQKQGYVLWENLNQARGARRLLQVAPLLGNATLGNARASLEMYGQAATLPEFVASETGLVTLTQAPMCLKPPEPCAADELYPAFVEFDRRLNVVAAEPLRLSETGGAPIDLAWGVGCQGANCTALAAPKTGPAPIYWVTLKPASDVFLAAGQTNDDSLRPWLAANEAVQEVDPLADIVTAGDGDAELVVWLTHFDPTLPYERPKVAAPDGRFAPVRALLQTLHTNNFKNEPYSVSLRARSLGGVSIAPSKDKDYLLGWTAIDKDVPQVFVTLISPGGQRKQLQMLTRTPGEVSDVDVERLSNGWAVGWIDERHQDPEVYLVKIADNLLPATPEVRLTETKGAAADLSLTSLGDQVLAVWGDARGGHAQHNASVYTRILNGTDLRPRGSETLLVKSSGHAHSIEVSRWRAGALVAWLENAAASASPQLKLAELDAQGKLAGDVKSLDVGATSLSGLALECVEQSCRMIFGGAKGAQAVLWGAIYDADSNVRHRQLTTLTGSPSQQLQPALRGNIVFFGEQSSQGQTRLRRLHIHWD